MKCYLCNAELTAATDSSEHVIPNGIGGKLQGKGYMCSKCNNGLSSEIDQVVIGQLGYLLAIAQALQEVPPKTLVLTGKSEEGQTYRWYGSELAEQFRAQIIYKGKALNDIIGTESFVRDRTAKVLKELKRLDPAIEPEKIQSIPFNQEPMPTLYFSNGTTYSLIGGPGLPRSILKIAVNYYLKMGGEQRHAGIAIRMIKEPVRLVDKVKEYYPHRPDQEVHSIGPEEVSHVLHLVGDPKHKVLYCYVELFNVYSYLVLLNDYYQGPAVSSTYCYDLIEKKIINKSVRIPLGIGKIVDYFLVDDSFQTIKQERYTKLRMKMDPKLAEKLNRLG